MPDPELKKQPSSAEGIDYKIKGLCLARDKIFAALSRFTKFVNTFSDPIQIGQLQVRLDQLQSLWSEFVAVQGDLEIFDDKEQSQFRTDFEDEYFESSGLDKTIIDKHFRYIQIQQISQIPQTMPQSPHHISQNQSNLPKIKLPEFFGSYELWLQFSDIYKSLIHNNTSLNSIEKFWYLKSCLKGDAAKLLLSLEVIESNYNIAWDMLCQRYENKRVIIQAHMKSFFEVQPITKESHVSLRGIIDNANLHLRALKSMGLPVDQWDCFVIFHIASKLDPATRREWEDFSLEISTATPTANDLFSFLSKRCQILENINSTNSNTIKTDFKHQNRSSNLAITTPNCLNCKRDHFIFSCGDFLKLNIQDRLNKIRSLKACTNCLRTGHSGKECRSSSTCKKCSLKHNTLLHFPKSSFSNKHNSNSIQDAKGSQTNQESSIELQNHESTVLSVSDTSLSTETQCILLPTACVLIQDNVKLCLTVDLN